MSGIKKSDEPTENGDSNGDDSERSLESSMHGIIQTCQKSRVKCPETVKMAQDVLKNCQKRKLCQEGSRVSSSDEDDDVSPDSTKASEEVVIWGGRPKAQASLSSHSDQTQTCKNEGFSAHGTPKVVQSVDNSQQRWRQEGSRASSSEEDDDVSPDGTGSSEQFVTWGGRSKAQASLSSQSDHTQVCTIDGCSVHSTPKFVHSAGNSQQKWRQEASRVSSSEEDDDVSQDGTGSSEQFVTWKGLPKAQASLSIISDQNEVCKTDGCSVHSAPKVVQSMDNSQQKWRQVGSRVSSCDEEDYVLPDGTGTSDQVVTWGGRPKAQASSFSEQGPASIEKKGAKSGGKTQEDPATPFEAFSNFCVSRKVYELEYEEAKSSCLESYIDRVRFDMERAVEKFKAIAITGVSPPEFPSFVPFKKKERAIETKKRNSKIKLFLERRIGALETSEMAEKRMVKEFYVIVQKTFTKEMGPTFGGLISHPTGCWSRPTLVSGTEEMKKQQLELEGAEVKFMGEMFQLIMEEE